MIQLLSTSRNELLPFMKQITSPARNMAAGLSD
jgi:hypothetical protein